MTGEIARHVIESFRRKRSTDPSLGLTPREEETLVLLTKGYANKEIAHHLGVSIETVRSHLKHIYEKMHVRSRRGGGSLHVGSRPSGFAEAVTDRRKNTTR